MNDKKILLIRLLISFLVVILILGIFLFYNYWPILTGQRIILDTRPVDPFDPFRGQYMDIGYEISRLTDVGEFNVGDTIYVLLEKDQKGIWRYNGTSKIKPSNKDFIKGKVESIYGNSMWVLYGIEQFFFEKNAEVPTQNITVEISVSNSGRAKLIQLLQNGKPIEIEYSEFSLRG